MSNGNIAPSVLCPKLKPSENCLKIYIRIMFFFHCFKNFVRRKKRIYNFRISTL